MRGGDARAILLEVGKSPRDVLRALRVEIELSDFVLGPVVGRTAQTVRRWRLDPGAEIPDASMAAIDDLRTVVAMMLTAGFDGPTIKRFLLSRNIGIGQDRPLDGLRVGLGAFRRVEHITECFISGVAPEPGSALAQDDGEEFEPAIDDVPQEPDAPRPVGVKQ
jgi:hypothetical protein